MIKSIEEHYKLRQDKDKTKLYITGKDSKGTESTIIFDLRSADMLFDFANTLNDLRSKFYIVV
jgi:hypothetical protein